MGRFCRPAGRPNCADRSIRLDLWCLDCHRGHRAFGHPHLGGLCDDDGVPQWSHDGRTDAGINFHGLGVHGVRSECLCVRLDRNATSSDLGASRNRSRPHRCTLYRSCGALCNDRCTLCLGFQLPRVQTMEAASVCRRSTSSADCGSSVVVSWAGMQGIVTLAAAFAIPEICLPARLFPTAT
jgi:hypothetical protein